MTLTTLTSGEPVAWLKKNIAQSLAHKAFSAEQVRDNEALAAKAARCSMFALMQRAGNAVFRQLLHRWPESKKVLCVVGSGNNGGDAYIVATLAKRKGISVTIASVDLAKPLLGDALLAQQQWLESGGICISWRDIQFNDFDVIVDGLLGTGLAGELKPAYRDIVSGINASTAKVISIDIPSGLSANTGCPLGAGVLADCTVSFVGIKCGLRTGVAKEYVGELIFDDLAIGAEFSRIVEAKATLVNYETLQSLPSRAINANKGSHGKLLCVGGNIGMPGAIRMSGEAALRCGAGLVKVFCHPDSELIVGTGRPELMLASKNFQQHMSWASCLAIGPGLGQDEWGLTLYRTIFKHVLESSKPLVVDADGLNLMAENFETGIYDTKNVEEDCIEAGQNRRRLVITPHPGEAARLLACTIEEIEKDRFAAAINLANKYQACCVLKGPGSIITDGQHSFVCTDGNPGMASGGMGDILTGIIAALLAQGLPTLQASVYGVCMHAKAADVLAERYGQRGILATDLFEILRQLVNWK
jgi:NAD(P)H-hydrate epimerase